MPRPLRGGADRSRFGNLAQTCYRAPKGYAPTSHDVEFCYQFVVSASLLLTEAHAHWRHRRGLQAPPGHHGNRGRRLPREPSQARGTCRFTAVVGQHVPQRLKRLRGEYDSFECDSAPVRHPPTGALTPVHASVAIVDQLEPGADTAVTMSFLRRPGWSGIADTVALAPPARKGGPV